MHHYSTRTVSRILLFSCGLFIYCSFGLDLVPPVDANRAPKTWYVCVAGFDLYTFTYSFEAGVLRACHLFAGSKNIRDNVIVISPDSAAYHVENAEPGKLVYGKSELSERWENEYDKLNITYKSQDMTTDVFYGILSGNKTAVKGIASEKVIESGPQDTIVLFFINIGIEGVMTLTNDHYLFAEEFIPFLEDLKEKKKFKQMLIIVDGQMAGSMFDGYLCTDCNIIAMTNSAKQDRLQFCDPNMDVYAYTSTCYTRYLLKQLQKLKKNEEYKKTNLFELFEQTRDKTWFLHESNTNLYGDLNVGNRKLSEFFSPN